MRHGPSSALPFFGLAPEPGEVCARFPCGPWFGRVFPGGFAPVPAHFPDKNIPDLSRRVQLQQPEALLGRCCLGPIWNAWVPTTPIARSRRDLQNVPEDIGLKPRKSTPRAARTAPNRWGTRVHVDAFCWRLASRVGKRPVKFPIRAGGFNFSTQMGLLDRCCLGPIWNAWVPTTPNARSRRDLQNVPEDPGLKPRKSAPRT